MTAKDYAAYSAKAGQMATEVRTPDQFLGADACNLASYYLRCASRELQKVAEWKAEQEKGVK